MKLNPTNCHCLQQAMAMTDSSVVARVSMMQLVILDIQATQHIPLGIMLLYVGLGFFPPWEY